MFVRNVRTNHPTRYNNPEDYRFGKINPRREGGREKIAEKDKELRIKERINNGPAEARRKESSKK